MGYRPCARVGGLVAAVAIGFASACTSTEGADGSGAPETCAHASDGVCDEPFDCALGTDDADCRAACASDPELAPIACAARGVPETTDPPIDPPPVASGGGGGPGGTWDGTIAARGPKPDQRIDRYFRVRVPPQYDPSRPLPLLYVLGGFRASMYSLAGYTEIERTADQNGFLVAYLEAYWHGSDEHGYVWDWFVYTSQWDPPRWEDNPDADFVRNLTKTLGALYNVDRTRVFAAGHSRGGAESIILAHVLPDVVAGYWSESGFAKVNDFTSFVSSYRGARRVPGVILHGRDDTDVPFREATALRAALNARGDVEGDDYLFIALDGVTHRWQPAENQVAWDFLVARPLPKEMLAP